MTAKHRKGKNNHKYEDNFFKQDSLDSEVHGGGNHYTLMFILFLLIVVGGATAAWFCFQQHQTITYLADNLMGMQMKVVKLQSSQEEFRQSNGKHISEGLESRLSALEESYAVAQKQVGMAMATAEQLKTTDLPAQVYSLQSEMKARLGEVQQASVSVEQLSQLQAMLKGKSEEFEAVKVQVEDLAGVSAELAQSVEALTGSLAAAESRLGERAELVGTLSSTLEVQSAELEDLKQQLASHQAKLDASTMEMATVRELLETEQSRGAQQSLAEEHLSTVRQSLLEQSIAVHSLHSKLRAQLETMQVQTWGEPVEDDAAEDAAVEVETAPVEEDILPAAAEEEEVEAQALPEELAEEGVAELDGTVVEQEDSVIEEQTVPAEGAMEDEALEKEAVEETEDLVASAPGEAPTEEQQQEEELEEQVSEGGEEELEEETMDAEELDQPEPTDEEDGYFEECKLVG
ncbi:uncharacterized protein FYW47_002373 [Aplochiton taeniatus]